MKVFKFIDIFGSNIKLQFKNKDKVSTTIGGILTFVTGISFLIAAYLLGNDVIFRVKPNSYIENILFSKTPPVTLDKHTYPLAFVISDGGGYILRNSSIFKIFLKYINYTFDENSTYYNTTLIELVNCRRDHFSNITDDIWNSVSASLCIDNQNITLQGNWGDPIVTYLSLNFFMCDYTNKSNNCGTKKEISDFIDNKKVNLNIYTVDSAVSVSNYSYPVSRYANNRYKFASSELTKVVQYHIKENKLRTDSGFFTESFSDISHISMEESQFDNYKLQTNNLMLNFNMFSSKQTIIQYRSYVKITEIFGSLGGILKLTLVVFELFCSPFAKINLISSLFLNLDLDDNNKNNNKEDKIFKSSSAKNSESVVQNKEVENSNNLFLNSSKNFNIKSNNILNRNSPKIFKKSNLIELNSKNNAFNKSQKLQLKITKEEKYISPLFIIYSKLLILCKCKTMKSKQSKNFTNYIKQEDKLERLFDISEIFKRMQKVNLLKYLLLKQDQSNAFDILFIDKNKEIKEDNQKHLDYIINKPSKTDVDKKLIELITSKFKVSR